MTSLRFDLHGLSIAVAAADPHLRSFVREHFEAERGTDPGADLSVRAGWRWGAERDRGAGLAERSSRGAAVETVGRGVALVRGGGRLQAVWTRVPDFPELQMAFDFGERGAGRLAVEAECGYSPRGVAKKLEYLSPARVEHKRSRIFFKMMYFMVYYPFAWLLERGRGWGLLHASAVILPSGRAVILSGLGGVGKSTLSLALLSRPGSRLLSDNLIFHDGERIYACPEPVRLDEAAAAGVAAEGLEPRRTELPASTHPKLTYRVAPSRRAAAAPPAAVCFLRFAPAAGWSDLEPRQTAEMLRSASDLAREVKDYRPCAALLGMLAAERGAPPPAPRADLERLIAPARCGIFRIAEGERVRDTAARLARHLESLA